MGVSKEAFGICCSVDKTDHSAVDVDEAVLFTSLRTIK